MGRRTASLEKLLRRVAELDSHSAKSILKGMDYVSWIAADESLFVDRFDFNPKLGRKQDLIDP